MVVRHTYTIKKILSGSHIYRNGANIEYSFVRVLVLESVTGNLFETVVSCLETDKRHRIIDLFDPTVFFTSSSFNDSQNSPSVGIRITSGWKWTYCRVADEFLLNAIEKKLINSYKFSFEDDTCWSKSIRLDSDTLDFITSNIKRKT